MNFRIVAAILLALLLSGCAFGGGGYATDTTYGENGSQYSPAESHAGVAVAIDPNSFSYFHCEVQVGDSIASAVGTESRQSHAVRGQSVAKGVIVRRGEGGFQPQC